MDLAVLHLEPMSEQEPVFRSYSLILSVPG
jgi:hypothetical protein